MNRTMQELAELRCEVVMGVMGADYSAVLRAKNALNDEAGATIGSPHKASKSKRMRQEYSYSYTPATDTLTETTSGKNIHRTIIPKVEFLKLVEVFVGLINSKGIFQGDEGYYKKSGYSRDRIRTAFRICVQLGVMKRTYMSGRLYSATGQSSGFLSAVEQAWKERAHAL